MSRAELSKARTMVSRLCCDALEVLRATKSHGIVARECRPRRSPVQSKDWILHFRSISQVIWDGGVGISPLAMESCVRDERGSTQPMRFV